MRKPRDRIKVLRLGTMFALCEGDSLSGPHDLQDWFSEPDFLRIAPVFHRNGVYLQQGKCWAELDGVAFLADARMFRYYLAQFEAERHEDHLPALLALRHSSILTRKQRELMYAIQHLHYLRKSIREMNLSTHKFLKETPNEER